MNLPQVARLMAGFAGFFTVAQLPAFGCALLEARHDRYATVAGFGCSLAIGALVAALLWGAIPFQWSGLLPNPFDAVFETVSGLTTTGASVLGSGPNPNVPDSPPSLLLWRALLQWIGGIGIVLVFVTLLPAMGITGKNLLSSESVGVGTESYQPRALEKARLIAAIYTGLTALCALLLVWPGGYGWFDAVCHAFTALSTGGFTTKVSIADFNSLGGELVLTTFMFLGGASFAVIATHWRSGLPCLRTLARSGEFRLYTLTTALLILFCTVALVRGGLPLLTALRQASFNSISVLTSTGYATADFQVWPATATLVLFGAMFLGGCSGSTAGGIKQVRFLVILKLLAYTIRHFVRPKSIERIKLDDEVLPAAVISSILAIVMLWCLTVAIGAVALSFDSQLNFVAALTSSATMVGNCGPALTLVDPTEAGKVLLQGGTAEVLPGIANVGPFGGFGGLADGSKGLMSLQMLFGRLELLTAMVLFSPSFWRR
ncbi:MAG: TrkH family potassium uptake protein [Planctomycetes bacterium]|nr:TrkH family potassium uptake protein [Planctomycetota bacterium]